MAEIINNYLSPSNFTISIQRIPNIEFFVQSLTLPSLTATPTSRETPLTTMFEINDKLQYSDLEMSFILDENMNNYKAALTDIYTASSIQQVKGARQSKAFNEVFTNEGSREIINERINNYKEI